MNWGDHRFQPVRCRFTPREMYEGREIRAELKNHKGEILDLVSHWEMDENDPYPGEWALGHRDCRLVLGSVFWIASGDVTVLSE